MEIKTWYVVFMGARGARFRFWQPFLMDGFCHVAMLTAVDGGTLKIENQAWGIDVKHTAAHVEDVVAALAPDATAVLQVTVDYARVPADYIPRGWLHCISTAQALLALRGGRWWFTPWLLYTYLVQGIQHTVKDSHVTVVPVRPYIPFMKKG